MAHWSDAYIGIPYVEGEFDCGELARRVQAEVFGREIKLPSERWYAGLTGAAKLAAMRDQIHALQADYASQTDSPVEGDGVLLVSRGLIDHIGIYCVIAGEPWILHGTSGADQVIRTRLRQLDLAGYRLEGFYRWI